MPGSTAGPGRWESLMHLLPESRSALPALGLVGRAVMAMRLALQVL